MRSHRTRANVLLAAAAWTIWVWATRMWNIARDPSHDLGFKAVHGVLALVSVGFAVAIGVIGLRMRREAGAAAPPPAEHVPSPPG
ncbi:MAG TPA: hypothetical protein VFD04_12630 [Actinomycetes bacterium]|nr:hypothetical protein [Actinomycetes bacterium]